MRRRLAVGRVGGLVLVGGGLLGGSLLREARSRRKRFVNRFFQSRCLWHSRESPSGRSLVNDPGDSGRGLLNCRLCTGRFNVLEDRGIFLLPDDRNYLLRGLLGWVQYRALLPPHHLDGHGAAAQREIPRGQ